MKLSFNRRHFLQISVLGTAGALLPITAIAGDPEIDAAKADGLIGERIDGYLGVVAADVPASLMRRVNEINNMRRALYAKLASETSTSVAAVARVTGERQIAGTAAGQYYMDDSGQWTRK